MKREMQKGEDRKPMSVNYVASVISTLEVDDEIRMTLEMMGEENLAQRTVTRKLMDLFVHKSSPYEFEDGNYLVLKKGNKTGGRTFEVTVGTK